MILQHSLIRSLGLCTCSSSLKQPGLTTGLLLYPALLCKPPWEITTAAVINMADQVVGVKVGVLALQGAFREHIQLLNRIPGVTASAVRTQVRA